MSDKIDSTEVGGFWDKLFYLVKLITGDVKISTKGTLQNQIDEMSTKVDDCFTSVGDGKKAVASAITDKGVTTAQNAEFATMAANVRKIKTNPTLQAKAITLDTSKTTQTLTPDPGYDGLSQVKASITTQTKSVNLSTSEQVVKPDSGKVLSQVTVPAVTGSAGLKDVVAGKTFNSATAGVDKTGALLDKRGTTVDAAAVDQDDTYTYFTVPTEAVYDAKSKLRTLSSNLGASFFVVAAQTNASEAISITASMAAPKSGYYKIESCNGTWDQIYMDVQLNTNTYTYVDEGKIIGVRIIKSSGVQGRFKAKLSYKENI